MGCVSLWILLLFIFLPVSGDKHSLFYLYTVQSDLSVNNTYQFSAETLLDDTQMNSYSSRDGIRTPKQSWVKEIEESVWKDGTEKLKYDGYLLNKFLNKQMKFSGHDPSERHVLQWRLGCEGETLPDGSVSPLNCINDLHYDGEDSISYNWFWRKWTVSASQSSDLEKKWNNEDGDLQKALHQKCEDCVKWLRIYLKYNPTDTSPTVPDVYVFVKTSQTESSRLTLTCLATGFYPKDLKMRLRRFTTSLPDHLLTSSGVRPNGDGTYQLRKSADVQEEDAAGYACSVEHSSLQEPIIKPWARKYCGFSCVKRRIIGGVMVVLVLLLLLVFIVIGIIVYKRRKSKSPPQSPPAGDRKDCYSSSCQISTTVELILITVLLSTGGIVLFVCVKMSFTDGKRSSGDRDLTVVGVVVFWLFLVILVVLLFFFNKKRMFGSSVENKPDENTVMLKKEEQGVTV